MYVERAMTFPDNPAVRAQAMEAAGEVLDEQGVIGIREGLDDEHPGVRFAACMALGKLGDRASLPAIRSRVNDPDPSVRVGAYFALERMGVYAYRRAWRNALREHENPEVRRNAALAMGHLDDKAVMPILRSACSLDDDEGVRLQALEALARLGDRDAINRFIFDAYGAIGYRQPFALLALGHVSDPQVATALRSQLHNALHLETRLAAARSLGTLGYREGFDLAMESLDWNDADENLPDDPPANQIMRVRSMAALALGDIGDPRALRALRLRMEEPDDARVQLAAATAILKILNLTAETAG
jgi:HEAT repeat protein